MSHAFLAILRFVGKQSSTFTAVAFETHRRKHRKAPSTLDVLLSKASMCVEVWRNHTWGPQRTVKTPFFLPWQTLLVFFQLRSNKVPQLMKVTRWMECIRNFYKYHILPDFLSTHLIMPYRGKSVTELISLLEWTLKEQRSFCKAVVSIGKEKLWQNKKADLNPEARQSESETCYDLST